MGNIEMWMKEDMCILKDYCNSSNKAWCNDFKILEQSKCKCSIFEKIIELSYNYYTEKCPHGTTGGWKYCMACRPKLKIKRR